MNVNATTNVNIFSLQPELLQKILKDTDTLSLFVCKSFYENFFAITQTSARQSYLKNKVEKIIDQNKEAHAQKVIQALYEKIIKSCAGISNKDILRSCAGISEREVLIKTEVEIVESIFEGKFIPSVAQGKTLKEIFTGHFSSFKQFEQLERQLEDLDLMKLNRAIPQWKKLYSDELKEKRVAEQTGIIRNEINHHQEQVQTADRFWVAAYRLTKLPKEIGLFVNLIDIKITYNKLQFLPAEIGNLKKLRTLQVSANKLQYLPVEIGNCENMVNLDLDNNNLRRLPNSISKLEKLEWLTLDRNPLIDLAKEVFDLPKLRCVSIDSTQKSFLSEIVANVLEDRSIKDKHIIQESEASYYEGETKTEKYRQKYRKAASEAFPHLSLKSIEYRN